MCVCVLDSVWMWGSEEEDVCLCLGQGVDMGEVGWAMFCFVWARVWIWEREEERYVSVFGTCRVWIWGREKGKCVSVFGTGCGYGRERMGDVRLCLGQGVDMGEGGWEISCCVWDRVWIWEREDGRCVTVFVTGCGYGEGKKGDI
jgi:hypothetical protein